MRAALDDLAAVAARTGATRRVAVLGDMLELGPDAAGFHVEVGKHAVDATDLLVTVGPLAAEMASGFDGDHRHVADAAEAAEIVPALLREGDVLLVKGSYGVGLRRLCDALTPSA